MKNILPTLAVCATSLALIACGGSASSPEPTPDPEPKPKKEEKVEEEKPIPVVVKEVKKDDMVFEVPEVSLNQVRTFALYDDDGTSDVEVSSQITMTEAQQAFVSNDVVMPYERYWNTTEVTPHPELFCEDPANAELVANAEKLGGYKKSHRIAQVRDATIPSYYPGFGVDDLNYAENSGVSDTGAVTIARPDLVGSSEKYAFFLSNVYGLFVLDHTVMPQAKPTVSCGMPIPGNAKNFLVVGDNILVLTRSMDNRHSGLIKLSVENNMPVVVESRVFENKAILDARLFNDTLAIYFKNYEPAEIDATRTSLASIASSPAVDIGDYYYYKEVNRELNVIQPLDGLVTVFTEVLEKAGYENELDDPDVENAPEKTRRYSYFNDFLSASGEYLIISETQRESVFSHYEQKRRRHCTNWETETFPYTYCRTLWETVPNPDYDASKLSKNSGVLDCQGKLFDCIKTELPTVSKTIRKAVGEECKTYERTRSYCTSYQYETYQVPRFNRYLHTDFTVYRFVDGAFIKLEDKLMNIDMATQTITPTDNSFKVAGQVYKHDHMYFNDGVFHVINQAVNGQLKLNTYAIAGNAAASVDEMTLKQAGGTWNARDLTALFTSSNLYLSNQSSKWNEALQKSILENVSLVDPLRPVSVNDFVIPTKLEQFAFMDDVLVGIGSTYLKYSGTSRRFGTVMAFDAPVEGGEVSEDDNSSILGADYQYYASSISHDDQVLHVDKANKRIIVPYYVSSPVNVDDDLLATANRVTLFALENGGMVEEETFSVEQPVIRSLSVNENAALAFANQSIYAFTHNDEWTQETVVNGEVPSRVYFLQNVMAQALIYDNAMHYTIELVNSPDSPTAENFGSVKLPKPMSAQCEHRNLYFDKDRILYVTEKPKTYYQYRDCPDTWEETELEFVGYHMGVEGFTEIKNESILRDLYKQIKWDLRCVLDPESEEYGYISKLTDEHDTSKMVCYPREDYYRIKQEKYDAKYGN